ncbi:cell division control protein [Trifolium repens]|nr:cell division control protein [Trifolium repens]
MLGTPIEAMWPGNTKLFANLKQYQIFIANDLSEIFLALDPSGLYLLMSMLCLDLNRRITTEAALKYRYFKDLGLHPEGEDDPMVYPAELDELLNKKMRY